MVNFCTHKNKEKLFDLRYSQRKIDRNFTYFRCKNCELVFIDPFPTQKELNRFYDYSIIEKHQNPLIGSFYNLPFFSYMSSTLGYLANSARAKCVRHYKSGGKVLDVGCGPGKFLFQLDSNYKLFGCEVSKSSSDEAKMLLREKGGKIYNCELVSCHFEKEYFDVISIWHVLEHVTNYENLIVEAGRILKKNGVLIIETPCSGSVNFELFKMNWTLLLPPEHLTFWSKTSYRFLLESCGLRMLSISYPTAFPFIFLSSYLNLLRNKKGDLGNLAYILIVLVFPISFAATLIFSILRRGDIIRVIAKKQG